MAVFTEILKPLVEKIRSDLYWVGPIPSVAYIENMEEVAWVIPIWKKLAAAGIMYPSTEFLGPFAVLWNGYQVVVIEEEGRAYFLTKQGIWEERIL